MLMPRTKSKISIVPKIPEILYNDKILDFLAIALDPSTRCLTLEGTIRSTKTVDAVLAFHLLVQRQQAPLALLAAEDNDAILDKLLKAERGLMTLWPDLYKLIKDDIGGYYVEGKTKNGIVKILLCGFADKSRWEKILGKDIETVLIDEANTGDEQFIDEAFGRQAFTNHPVMIFTLNGDDPQHWIYQNRINKSVIVGECPASIRADMDAVKIKKRGYYYFWFSFIHNPAITVKKKTELRHEYPVGSYYHKTRILGERGKWGILIYADYIDSLRNFKDLYIRDSHGKKILDPKYGICHFVLSIDVAQNKAFNTFILHGYPRDYSSDYILDCLAFKSNEGGKSVGYSKKTQLLKVFLAKHLDIQPQFDCIVVDSAEDNYIRDLRNEGLGIPVIGSWKATIKQRIDLNIICLNKGNLIFDLACMEIYNAFLAATWVKGKEGLLRSDPGGKDADTIINDWLDGTEYGQTLHMYALSGGKMRGEAVVSTT